MAGGDDLAWVEDELHALLGFSDGATAAYVCALARDAASPDALLARLAADGVALPDPDAAARFATAVLARIAPAHTVHPRATRETIPSSVRESDGARLTPPGSAQRPEGHAGGLRTLAAGHGADAGPSLSKASGEDGAHVDEIEGHRIGLSRKKRRRPLDQKKAAAGDSEPNGEVFGPESTATGREEPPDLREEDKDILERDAFAERLRRRDRGEAVEEEDAKRSGGDSTSHVTNEVPDDDTIARLRELSRRTYLKKREAKELMRLREEIEDEKEVFRGETLTERERRDLELKEELYKLASTRVEELREDDPDETRPGGSRGKRVARYRMPEAYGGANDTRTDQQKKMDVLTARFEEHEPLDARAAAAARRAATDQGRWEDAQIHKASAGAALGEVQHVGIDMRGSDVKKYDIVFDPSEFVASDAIPRVDGEIESGVKPSVCGPVRSNIRETFPSVGASAAAKDARAQKIKKQRESLPMFRYRDALIEAVRSYQVLVVESETGSGKTTQIPQYLIESGFGRIACTQPRRVAAMSVAARVAEEMGVKLGAEVGYSIRFEDCTSDKTVIKYMTDGMLLREFLSEPDLGSYNVIIVDEAHERSLSTDIVMGLVKDIARFRGDDIRVIISSATLNAKKFSTYFDDAPIFRVPGRMYGVDVLYAKAPQADHVDACCVTVLQIHASQPPGDILVFLTGQDEIEAAEDSLRQRTRGLGSRLGELVIAPIYATLPSDLQAKIFEPTPPGARKVVLATNIAETSVTIPGIVYVIDPGYCKQKSYNAKTGIESLLVVAVSQAGAIQRAGRAGRTQPGKCFRLYTKWSFHNEMDKDTTPEILRTNLAQVVLTLMSLGIDNLLSFDFLDAPPVEALSRSLEQLYALGALNERGQLTKLGRRMAELPLDPMMAKALLASEQFKCSEEVAVICAMLSVNNAVFYRPKEKKLLADAAHSAFARGGGGDHIRLLNCYVQWRDSGYSTQWCYENFVQARTIKKARDVREQLDGLLERVEVELVSAGTGAIEQILKAMTAGFFYNGCKLQKNGQYKTLKNPHTVEIHPSSSLAKTERPPRWLIYHELVRTSKEFMRQVFEIDPKWLLEVAGHYYKAKDIDDEKAKRKMPKVL